MSNADQSNATLTIETAEGVTTLRLTGDWTVFASQQLVDLAGRKIAEINAVGGGHAVIDTAGIAEIDTAGAWLVRRVQRECVKAGLEPELSGMRPGMAELMEAIPEVLPEPEPVAAVHLSPAERFLDPIGRSTVAAWHDIKNGVGFFGALFIGMFALVTRRGGINMAAITSQLDRMGVRAVPIIALMSFLVGGIIAQQGAFQLSYFGAQLFVVDLVGILQLREIGVLLTAIMVAGRSGSAITAEIGAMRMREEVDALRVMGFDPISVLVFPRMLALLIALPLLTIVANFSALIGAAVTLDIYAGITYQTFLQRLNESVDMSTVISGMAKAPFMALIITIVSALEGMKVGGSAESLGQKVTAAVVKAIFVVIVVDGIFAIFYATINF